MGHELQRSLVGVTGAGVTGGSYCIEHFPVRPFIVSELAAQIVSKIHETTLHRMFLRLQCNW
jgi:hypothetical protein